VGALIWGRIESVEPLRVLNTVSMSAVVLRLSTRATPAAGVGLADTKVVERRKRDAKRRANIVD
jgi:hypothetical protein